MTLTLDEIRQTNAHAAVHLRRAFFGPLSWAVYVVALSPVYAAGVMNGDWSLALAATAALLWVLWVIHRFVFDCLMVDTPEAPGRATADRLSYRMVEHLCDKPEVTPLTLLQAATESRRGMFVLRLVGLEPKQLLQAVTKAPIAESLETCLGWIDEARQTLGTRRLDSTATIFAFLTHVESLTQLLNAADLSADDLRHALEAEAFHFAVREQQAPWYAPGELVHTVGSVGRSWMIGYNNVLERLTVNVSEHILSHKLQTVLHGDVLGSAAKLLAQGSGVNLLILGGQGCGKSTFIRNLAYQLRESEISRGAHFTDVLILKASLLLSGSGGGDQALLKALHEINEGGRFILVIEDMAPFITAADARLKAILVSLLESKNVRTVCLADPADYHTHVKSDPLLDGLLQKIYFDEPSDKETMSVLLEEYFTLERKRGVRVTYKALKSLVELCHRCIGRGCMPGKAVNVLQQAATAVGPGATVTDDEIREVVSRISRIDVRALSIQEKTVLLQLKDRLTERIIGQEHALQSITDALKRARMDVTDRKRPIGTFLFLGTTGVGKTETAKALAEEYFGTGDHFLRVDLNEYSDEGSIPSLIGGRTAQGFTEGILTRRVQDMPFSLILLDEIEKAHPKVLHLFLQILDEGGLIDGQGVRTDFRHTIIIATSNAGGQWILSQQMPADQAGRDAFRKALIDEILRQGAFSPEFFNRFDEAIVFYPLTGDEVQRVAVLMLDGLIRDMRDKRGIQITMEPGAVEVLAQRGFSPQFGAREMRRTLTQTVETYLADYLLTHEVKRGDTILIRAEDLKAKTA